MKTENQAETGADTGEEAAKTAILQAALPLVPFDGWSDQTFRAAVADSGVASGLAKALFPRGGIDLALGYHRQGDTRMTERLAGEDLSVMRYSARVAHAIRARLDLVQDKELVRRGTTLFALPQHAAEGAKAIWGTADAIWKALGDSSEDFEWYSKRATLSAVYGSTVLFWLGDDSPGHAATWAFLDRRIENVMQVEKLKAGLRDNPVVSALRKGPFSGVFDRVGSLRKPQSQDDLPGHGRG